MPPKASTFHVAAPGPRRMRSGQGVLMIATAQLLLGLSLLALYEGYKKYFFGRYLADLQAQQRASSTHDASVSVDPRVSVFESPIDFHSPMGFTFYFSIVVNVFAISGLAGVLNAHRELIIAFFAFNAAQVVLSFTFFVDMLTDAGISYSGEPPELSGYEKASAALLFLNLLLGIAASVCAMRAIDEIRSKQREDYGRLTVLSDTLAFEPDHV